MCFKIHKTSIEYIFTIGVLVLMLTGTLQSLGVYWKCRIQSLIFRLTQTDSPRGGSESWYFQQACKAILV